MQNVLKYLQWENTEKGVRITKCDKSFEGAMALPDHIDGIPIVEIGKWAFAGCEKITSVVIPDTVEVIGEAAFYECDGLEELRLDAGIKKIEKQAFTGCSSLSRVVLPSTLEELSADAFDESVDVIANDGTLASRAVGLREHGSFYSDASLEKSEDALKYLKWEITKKGVRITGCNIAFEGTMTIPSRINGTAVVEIGDGAFYHCRSIKSVEIPDSVEVVGEEVFCACDRLEELRLGKGIKKIEKRAFWSCDSLKSVEIPGSVEVVGENAFSDCSGLEELRLGAGIKRIEERAFARCSSLRRVVLPSTLEELSPDAFDDSVDLIVDDDSLSNDDDERL